MPKRTSEGQTQQERSGRTTEKVLEVAEKHFALGYATVSTDALVQEVGLTRGALYHHFGNKQGLFEAVVERLQKRVGEVVEHETAAVNDGWQRFLAGCFAWLDAVTDRAALQILLIDAPAVLGWERWLEFDARHGSRLLREGLEELAAEGILEVASKDALLHLLNGAMNQGALWVAQSPRPEQTLGEVKEVLRSVLEGLRA